MVEIVSFAGRLKSGKSSLSEHLINNYDYHKIAFADFMKHSVSEAFEIPLNDLYDPNKKEKKFENPILFDNVAAAKLGKLVNEDLSAFVNNQYYEEYRSLMQFLGTEVFRKIDPDFHVKKTLMSLNENKKYVLEDLRFQNEFKYLNSFNSKMFYLIRPYYWNYSNHSSETSLHWSQFKNIIYNSPVFSLQDFMESFEEKRNSNFQFPHLQQYNFFNQIKYESVMIGSYLYNTNQLSRLPSPLKFKDKTFTKSFINISEVGDTLIESFTEVFLSDINLVIPNFFMLEDLKLWNLNKYPENLGNKNIYNVLCNFQKPEYDYNTFDYFWSIGEKIAKEALEY